MTLVSTYPYLFMSLTLFVIFVLCYLAGGRQRLPMLLSAVLSAPFAFLSIHFVPAYWEPVRVVEFGTGIEDLLFSFANGGIVWFMVTLPVHKRISIDIRLKRVMWRYMVCSIGGLSLGFIPIIILGYDPMKVALAGIIIVGAVLLWFRPELWIVSAVGAVGFGAFYTVICLVSFYLNPWFLHQWNPAALSGYTLMGVPIEEIVWSIAFGAVWSLVMAYSFETRILPIEQKQETRYSTHYPTDTSTV